MSFASLKKSESLTLSFKRILLKWLPIDQLQAPSGNKITASLDIDTPLTIEQITVTITINHGENLLHLNLHVNFKLRAVLEAIDNKSGNCPID